MTTLASTDWASALATALGSSSDVRENAATWIYGPIALVVDPDASRSFAGGVLVLDVHEGSVNGVTATSTPVTTAAPFELRGTADRWKSVFAGELTIGDAVLESKLQVRGDLPTLLRHRGLLDALSSAAAGVDTAWPEAPQG